MAKKPHLTDAERLKIESMLDQRCSLNQIAAAIGKNRSTISREIQKRAIEVDKFPPHYPQNRCIKRRDCNIILHCDDKPDCTRKKCSTCNRCNKVCEAYQEESCWKLLSVPYVCNGCSDRKRCPLKKCVYAHKEAHEAYHTKLVESRQGANISEEELHELDKIVTPLLKQGQSVSHIFAHNANKFNLSEKSVYRYVAGGLLQANNLDMPRVVRFKLRKRKPVEHKIDCACRIGRTIGDFRKFIEESKLQAVEMDTVKGGVSGKVLLTMMFKSCDFMLAFLRDSNTSQTVIDRFEWLYDLLGPERFKAIFPVFLTDNGSEFSNPKALEFDKDGNRRTYIFYCDPQASWQKPNVELNHEFIRKILPKGFSMNGLTQADVDLMMSHINSYSREKLGGKSPIEMFDFLYGEGLAEKLGQSKIPSNSIILKPSLLKR